MEMGLVFVYTNPTPLARILTHDTLACLLKQQEESLHQDQEPTWSQ